MVTKTMCDTNNNVSKMGVIIKEVYYNIVGWIQIVIK
jgi:hypothetical protein